VTDAPPIIINEDAAIDSAFFGSHAGRSCYARATLGGLTWHFARPLVQGLDFEMDVRGVAHELVI
jgi:hypothetical protein